MFLARTKFELLLIFGFCMINAARCTIILMTGGNERATMYIANDMEISNLKVVVPNVTTIDIGPGDALDLPFTGMGEVIVMEDDNEIMRTNVGTGYFNIVRTHSNAYITKSMGPITINQTARELNLMISGCNGGHVLSLNEGDTTDSQNISASGDNISISQSCELDNQNLSFVGSAGNIALNHVGLPNVQNLSINGRGGYSTSISKSGGITVVTQTN